MNKAVSFVFMFLFLISFTVSSYAAQSTADVSASDELKQSAREEILGSKADEIITKDEYVIGHGDIVSVSIYGEGDMAASARAGTSRETGAGEAQSFGGVGVRVMMDGRISLKHVGDVEVIGMTLTQLADYLKKLYSTIYEDPIITTTLEQSNSLHYTIMGNVAQPGNFLIEFPLNLVQALARSGSFTEWADRTITVVRKDVKKEDAALFNNNTLKFDYDDFISGEELENNIFIQDGDIIVVN